jgi:hypothetical protein
MFQRLALRSSRYPASTSYSPVNAAFRMLADNLDREAAPF